MTIKYLNQIEDRLANPKILLHKPVYKNNVQIGYELENNILIFYDPNHDEFIDDLGYVYYPILGNELVFAFYDSEKMF